MHFFTSALTAALAVGSAMAVPMNVERHLPLPACSGAPTVTVTEFLPLPSSSVPSHSLPSLPTSHPQFPVSQVSSVALVSSVSSVSSAAPTPAPALPTAPPSPPAVGLPDKNGGGAPNVIVIIKEINIEIIEVEKLINIDIEIIHKLISTPNPDPESLKKAIISLKLHLSHIVTDIVPVLEGVKGDAGALVEADLKIVLALIVKIEAIVAEIELLLKKVVVSVSAKVLVFIAAELKAVIVLVPKLTGAILKIVLGLVAKVEISFAVVGKITVAVSHVTALVASITGLLVHPTLVTAFKHIAAGGSFN